MGENGRTVVSCERKYRKNGGFLPTAPCPLPSQGHASQE